MLIQIISKKINYQVNLLLDWVCIRKLLKEIDQ
jgi:hypothetical protein